MKKSTIIQLVSVVILIGIIAVVILAMPNATQSPTIDTPVENSSTENSESAMIPASPAGDTITNSTQETMDNEQNTQAIITTNQGTFTLELYGDLAPKTVENFTKLADDGFYDGTRFHRVIDGFMIQGGDPLSKDESAKDRWGTGGPGYTFADEIHEQNNNDVGTIAMANAGPNTNGSQFFINVADNNFLDTKHTVFGEIVDGMDVVRSISTVDTDERDRPTEDVIIESIEVTNQ